MMISPEVFIKEYEEKSYKELLAVRDGLLESIKAFEERGADAKESGICPSPEVVYQCNLEYLGKLCELISQKYNEEFVWNNEG